ncbi:MAG: MarR family winged helix-turn-helix transcriptional regulator [Elioraea sp.]|nr:MarR family winged helix-turn-helix transcriptional regulator [Elioraea sp.]
MTSPTPQHAKADRGSTAVQDYVLEQQVGHLLRRAHQRHAALFVERIGAAALTPMQWAALVSLVRHGPTTQNRLGRLAAMDPATTQGVVRRLVSRGLVVRSADPADRRTKLLAATQAGEALVAATLPIARAISDATLAPLNEAERRIFLKLLTRMAFA